MQKKPYNMGRKPTVINNKKVKRAIHVREIKKHITIKPNQKHL